MKRAMQSAMRLNAKGIKVMVSGRLAGNEIARSEWLREGTFHLTHLEQISIMDFQRLLQLMEL